MLRKRMQAVVVTALHTTKPLNAGPIRALGVMAGPSKRSSLSWAIPQETRQIIARKRRRRMRFMLVMLEDCFKFSIRFGDERMYEKGIVSRHN